MRRMTLREWLDGNRHLIFEADGWVVRWMDRPGGFPHFDMRGSGTYSLSHYCARNITQLITNFGRGAEQVEGVAHAPHH